MAKGKRAGKGQRRLPRMQRLGTASLVLNAGATFVGVPALVVVGVLLWMGEFGGTAQNQHLFLGGVAMLLAAFIVLLGGLKTREHIVARKRFRELLAAERKSQLVQNLDEVQDLARALGEPHKTRLKDRMAELGIKR